MKPKGKLFALLTIFVAIGLVTATGAFTTVQADRTATVNVAGDANALLGIQDNSGGEYVITNGGANSDQTQIDLSSSTITNGDGINPNAITTIDDLLTIANNGQNNVGLVIGLSSDGTPSNTIEIYNVSSGNDLVVSDVTAASSSEAEDIDSGTSMDVGIKVDLVNGDPADLSNLEVTFYATESYHSSS